MSLLKALRDILLSAPPIKLRCRPGDIARITQRGQNLDKWVKVEYAIEGEPGIWRVVPLQEVYAFNVGIWVGPGSKNGVCEDRHMQPIRDRPGEDETLRWVPKRRPLVVDTGVIRPKQSVWPA